MTWLLENWFPLLVGWTACAIVVTAFEAIMFRINPRDE